MANPNPSPETRFKPGQSTAKVLHAWLASCHNLSRAAKGYSQLIEEIKKECEHRNIIQYPDHYECCDCSQKLKPIGWEPVE